MGVLLLGIIIAGIASRACTSGGKPKEKPAEVNTAPGPVNAMEVKNVAAAAGVN